MLPFDKCIFKIREANLLSSEIVKRVIEDKMQKITFSIVGFFIISTLSATQASNVASPQTQQSESSNPKTNIQTSSIGMDLLNIHSPLSEEQKARYDIMRLAGGYFELLDQKDQNDVMEQSFLIESIRNEIAHQKHEKSPSCFTSKTLQSPKVFGNSHIEAALSIVRVHSKHFSTLLSGVKFKFVGWGGRFIDKINRVEMLYAIDKMPVTSEWYAMMLFSYIEDINMHEERFGPYLATFPFSSEEYELRLMLADYRTLSTKETPQPAFIFNIGETIFSCYRELGSGLLKVFKKELFSDIIANINKRINQEKDEKNLKKVE